MSMHATASSSAVHRFKRVLVANRGEIALRIIRALRELQMESVAVYALPDRESLHVRSADYAVQLPGSALKDTYLNEERLLQAARLAQADAIHPGYGFLSESSTFAARVETEPGITFIGPSSKAMNTLGNKVQARALLQKHHIPILPGSTAPITALPELTALSHHIGFPVVLKASAGGGGKGMRIVWKESELQEAFAAAQREATTFFGCPDIFCEKYLPSPRHIEFQTLFDQHGHGIHLFERDCSVQRRCQKVFEEAPSVFLTPESRQKMGEIAVQTGLLANYAGAGTIEFICDHPQSFYFMEMNTRIQVEHPVTEMITGVDLIKETIRIAEGHPLSLQQDHIRIQGYALEARINAEDPTQNFLPSTGTCEVVQFPSGPFVRVDSHIFSGYAVPDLYDSLLAKIIVWGQDRTEALTRMKRALQELHIAGITTTALLHEALLHHPLFIKGEISTTFLEQEQDYFQQYYQQCLQDASTHPGALLLSTLLAEAHYAQRYAPHHQPPSDHSLWRQYSRKESLHHQREDH